MIGVEWLDLARHDAQPRIAAYSATFFFTFVPFCGRELHRTPRKLVGEQRSMASGFLASFGAPNSITMIDHLCGLRHIGKADRLRLRLPST